MTLYIVRHGESEGNAGRFHQHDGTPLTPLGISQAQQVGKRLQHVNLSRIISSPTKRTRQTTAEIVALNPAPVTFDPRLKEITRPSKIHEVPHTDLYAKKVIRQINAHVLDPNWHHSDEDNTFDFLKRVSEGFHDLEQYYSEENITVVAHGDVLRAILGLVLFGSDFSLDLYERFVHKRVITTNTGITLLKFTPEEKWQLVTYNDHAHLLD